MFRLFFLFHKSIVTVLVNFRRTVCACHGYSSGTFTPNVHSWLLWWAVSDFEGVTSVVLTLTGFCAQKVFSCFLIVNMLFAILTIAWTLDRLTRKLQRKTLCALTQAPLACECLSPHSVQVGLTAEPLTPLELPPPLGSPSTANPANLSVQELGAQHAVRPCRGVRNRCHWRA